MTRVVPADAAAIEEAAGLLRRGRLVAFPTETVYGLGAVATSDTAVAAVYAAKGRPAHNPLIVHLKDRAAAHGIAVLDPRAEALAERFWPGPLTLVVRAAPGSPISRRATAGLETIALRVPAHPVTQALLARTVLPVAAPSANPSGRTSPTTAAHVAADLAGRVDLVLDGGACPVGVESTVVDLSVPDRAVLLRPGGITRDALVAAIGRLAEPGAHDDDRPRSPGRLLGHYAPRLPLRLDAQAVAPDEALLGFGPSVPPGARMTLNLSPSGDLGEAARNLFAMLRRLDASDAVRIAVVPIPGDGLGEAIRDRLARAAAPR